MSIFWYPCRLWESAQNICLASKCVSIYIILFFCYVLHKAITSCFEVKLSNGTKKAAQRPVCSIVSNNSSQ